MCPPTTQHATDYYVIEGQRYASYLYIRYLNRAMDPNAVTWINGLFRCACAACELLAPACMHPSTQ